MTIKQLPAKIALNMCPSVLEKVAEIQKIFGPLSTEQRYLQLIAMGRQLPPYSPSLKTPAYLVRGCQSTLYLYSSLHDGKLYFQAHSDALISAGLAALLIAVYSGQTPETILTHPPTFLTELGLAASLSPNRSHGLAHIHLRMKQDALQSLLPKA